MDCSYSVKYINKLKESIDNIDHSAIDAIIELLEKAEKNGDVIYFIGNGGSAATASHFATDMSVGLRLRKIRNFNTVCLSDNVATVTAVSNDVGYENVFYAQLINRLRPNDLLIAISASGNSPNIIRACEYAKKVGAKIVGCTGFDGGKLKALSDVNFHVATEKGEYGIVEDLHMMLDHIIYSYYIEQKAGSATKYELD